jgi:SAM-dependent methyltransferase
MLVAEKVRQLPDEWEKINLGCNQKILPGWTNVDIHPFEGVDVTANLEEDWPWEDDSVDYIRAFDLLEHLRDPIHTMNEAWRVLRNRGIFEVWVPSTDGRGAFQDPTHVSFWNQNSFLYYDGESMNGMYLRIKCDFRTVFFNTQPNNAGVVWTWGFCRAVKSSSAISAVTEEWYTALTSMDNNQRVMPGYEGSTLGTTLIG